MNQFTRFDTTTLGLVLLAGLIFHFALLLFGRKWDTLGLLAGLFFVLAPLSAAIDVPGVEILKWARVYVALLMVLIAGGLYRGLDLGPGSIAWLVFSTFFFVAAIWSDDPVQAVLIKGIFYMIVVAGLLLGSNIASLAKLRVIIRILAIFSAVWVIMVPLGIALGRGEIIFGRLNAWGLNPNRLGGELAPMLISTAWVAIYDRSKPWKIYGFAVSGAIALIVVLTGSRTSLAIVLLIGAIYAIPLVRKPGVLIGFGVGVAIIGLIVLTYGQTSSSDRLTEVNLDTRMEVWDFGLSQWRQSPVIGTGWAASLGVREGGGSQNFHSIYLQALVESGVVGLLMLLIVVGIVGFRSLMLLKRTFGDPYASFACFSVATAMVPLVHGAGESGTVQGSNINSLLAGVGIVLVDRIAKLIHQQHAEDGWYADELHDEQHAHEHYLAHDGQPYDPSLAAQYGEPAQGPQPTPPPSTT
jgi:O-antigen ligase